MAIYDTMQFVPNDIVTVGIGMAASMGQLLLTAGTKGKRYITPNARVLLHQPHGGFGGTSSDIQTQAQLILDMKKPPRRDHRRADRQDRRAGQRGRRPRPLVHRPGGARVRLRRPHPRDPRSTSPRSPPAPRTRSRTRKAIMQTPTFRAAGDPDRLDHRLESRYILPYLRGAHRLRLQAPGPVRQAVRGPHHLPRRAGGRRVRRRRHGPAARARVARTPTATS